MDLRAMLIAVKSSVSSWKIGRFALLSALLIGGLMQSQKNDTVSAQISTPNIDEEVVYLDNDGIIRILDPTVSAYGEIIWSSPMDGFIDFALGDFNADGDLEIAAIRNDGLEGEIYIYDPVISSATVTPDGWINDIPWKRLAVIDAPSDLTLIDAGNFDVNVQGDEIIYGFETDTTSSALTILKGNKTVPTGTTWLKHITKVDFSLIWHEIAVGNIDGEQTDEIVLISRKTPDDDVSRFHVYRIDDGGLINKLPFATRDGIDFSWQDAAIGEVKNVGYSEIVAIRESNSASFPSILIYQYFRRGEDEGLRFDPGDDEYIDPSPFAVFLGNVSGVVNSISDNEIGLLRSVPANSTKPHFFTQNSGNDGSVVLDLDVNLGSNAWQAGAAGDVDGDGKDEYVLMSNSAHRIFMNPDVDDTFIDFLSDTVTTGEHIQVGNLDANGVLEPVVVKVAVSGLENGLPTDSTGTVTISLTSDTPVNYALDGQLPDWITSLDPVFGLTPAEITATIDTADLASNEYTQPFDLSSVNPFVRFEEESVEIILNVLADTFAIDTGFRSGPVIAAGYPCVTSTENTVTAEIEITGSSRTSYTAVLLASQPLTAAQAELGSATLAGRFDANNNLELSNAAGASMTIATGDLLSASLQLQAADKGADTIRWPSGVTWVSAESDFGSTDDTITITFDTAKAATESESLLDATLIIVADEETVAAPFNVRFIPLSFLCATTRINLPIIEQ